NRSVHQITGYEKISQHVLLVAYQDKRLPLLRPLFPRKLGPPHSALCPQAVSRSFLLRGLDAEPPAPLLAVLHQALSRALRNRPHYRRPLCGSRPRCASVSRRTPPRFDQEPRRTHDGGGRERIIRT